jgi:hypothetical protein
MEGLTLILLYLAIPSLLFSAVRQILSWRKSGGSKAKLPGPQLFPVVGRVHDLPRFQLWLKFQEWAEEHGPIFFTKMLNQPFIIVSDEKIAEELLVKRGNIYSGRPQIRSLIRHKEGPAYSALMDRHGESPPEQLPLHHCHSHPTPPQTAGKPSASGATPPWQKPTGTTSTGTSSGR